MKRLFKKKGNLCLIFLSYLVTFSFLLCVAESSSNNYNPYRTLGLSNNQKSSQEEIRKQYKKLCLLHHPDKNVNKSQKEQQKSERLFKEIQKAYSDIGTAESRKNYHDTQRNESILRQYYQSQQNQRQRQNPYYFNHPYYSSASSRSRHYSPFYVNGVDVSHFFNPSANSKFRSVYETTVYLDLKDLYTGIDSCTFDLNENYFSHYKAAFRGGLGQQIVSQGFLSSLAILLKSGWLTSLFAFSLYVHMRIPKIEKNRALRRQFSSKILKGWKSGTKLKFSNVEPGIDVVFILKEKKHEHFERCGNDLKTEFVIQYEDYLKQQKQETKKNNNRKLRIHVQSLDSNEGKMEITLNQSQMKQLEQEGSVEITASNRGWPIRSTGGRGNLIVRVMLSKHGEKRRKKKRIRE